MLDPQLLNYLSKGSFPLGDAGGCRLWEMLLSALEKDADGTWAEIKGKLKPGVVFEQDIHCNGVTIDPGHSEVMTFLGYMHAKLCSNHGLAAKPPLQGFIQRVRSLAEDEGVQKSKVNLYLDANTKMGNGLDATTLTFLPDSSLGATFGTVPDQKVIGAAAPVWQVLKKRAYENQPLTAYGGKPHYVLAHLLNHNLNGPGDKAENVVPFWATANTQMANRAERYVKELVLRGIKVHYTILQGAAVGMTTQRKALLKSIDTMKADDEPMGDRDVQKKVVEYEQYLPINMVINCDAWDATTGGWVTVVNNVAINNYVPLTVPYVG